MLVVGSLNENALYKALLNAHTDSDRFISAFNIYICLLLLQKLTAFNDGIGFYEFLLVDF